ncbi:putative anion:Na(+) symporter [Weissella koreensis KACC 15510]|uniref:SLC13 family permease n=1 Tax=Weissella koreensis TaxID=165096 RepID=UPI00021756F5|nr:SLC13 family permease [Weissella koreensis]AEJ23494.1 putative anion:Na(+) symporter [Weissella koreensis KACC 15510]
MINRIFTYLKEDVMFTASMVLAVITSLLVRPDIGAVNWHTVFSLMTMMIWVGFLEKAGILHTVSVWLVNRSHHARTLMTSVTFLSFFGAMLLSNDIAILTILPIYLKLADQLTTRLKVVGSTLVIMAANSGAILFPFGKSQNLYMFVHYKINVIQFFEWSASLTIATLVLMFIITRFVRSTPIQIDLPKPDKIHRGRLSLLTVTGIILIITIFGWTPFNLVVPLILIAFFLYNPKMFNLVDFGLLATFIFFFIATNNLAHLEEVKHLIETLFDTKSHVLFGTFFLSQFISNLPSTILISTFTDHAYDLFIGSNIGGYGSIFASMANLIGYRVFRQLDPKFSWTFLKVFMIVNFAFAAVLLLIFGLWSL